MTSTLDPIDFEVLRHRLWMINDEQGRVAAQVSGSPAVYEAKDFNTSLLTPRATAFTSASTPPGSRSASTSRSRR